MTLQETLTKFQQRRKFPNWQPKPPTNSSSIDPATTEVIRRICHLVDLEVTVGSWVTKALQALPENDAKAATAYITKNAKDESKHERVMHYLAKYVDTQPTPPEAQAIVTAWQDQPPSFALAYALEMGVFMTILPWLTKQGDMYCVKVAQWIADDEGVHVLTNRELATVLGEPVTLPMARLIKRTLTYIFADEAPMHVARSIRRVSTGSDPEMMNESVAITPAFFEQHDKRSVVY